VDDYYGWMIAFIICNSILVPLLEGQCSSSLCRFEFPVFEVFAGIEATTSGLTVPRCDHLNEFYIVSDKQCILILFGFYLFIVYVKE